jgi:hypothetical protein
MKKNVPRASNPVTIRSRRAWLAVAIFALTCGYSGLTHALDVSGTWVSERSVCYENTHSELSGVPGEGNAVGQILTLHITRSGRLMTEVPGCSQPWPAEETIHFKIFEDLRRQDLPLDPNEVKWGLYAIDGPTVPAGGVLQFGIYFVLNAYVDSQTSSLERIFTSYAGRNYIDSSESPFRDFSMYLEKPLASHSASGSPYAAGPPKNPKPAPKCSGADLETRMLRHARSHPTADYLKKIGVDIGTFTDAQLSLYVTNNIRVELAKPQVPVTAKLYSPGAQVYAVLFGACIEQPSSYRVVIDASPPRQAVGSQSWYTTDVRIFRPLQVSQWTDRLDFGLTLQKGLDPPGGDPWVSVTDFGSIVTPSYPQPAGAQAQVFILVLPVPESSKWGMPAFVNPAAAGAAAMSISLNSVQSVSN